MYAAAVIVVVGLLAGALVVAIGIGIVFVVVLSAGPRSLAPGRAREEPRPQMMKRDAAQRLARAIAADIRLHGAEKNGASSDVRAALATEIVEGRSLFRSRADPDHHDLYESAIDELVLSRPGN